MDEACRYEDVDWLRKKYYEEKKTIFQIADECDVEPVEIYDSMQENGIKTWADRGVNHPGSSSYTYKIEYTHSVEGSHVLFDRLKRTSKETPSKKSGGVYGVGWNRNKKQKIRARDGFRCVDCGLSQKNHKEKHDERLHVHHLTKAREIDDADIRNSPENLITLCRDCHRRWEKIASADVDLKISPELTRMRRCATDG